MKRIGIQGIQKRIQDNFTPVSDTKYSAFNSKLSIFGQSIPFLGDEPLNFWVGKYQERRMAITE